MARLGGSHQLLDFSSRGSRRKTTAPVQPLSRRLVAQALRLRFRRIIRLLHAGRLTIDGARTSEFDIGGQTELNVPDNVVNKIDALRARENISRGILLFLQREQLRFEGEWRRARAYRAAQV